MKQKILNTISDLVGSFLYYDRREDEDLKFGDIENTIGRGDISVNEIVDEFKLELLKKLG